MLFKMEIILQGLPKRINEYSGAHWTTRYKESQRWHKALLGRMLLNRITPPPMPLQKAKLTLVRHSSRAPDYDGLVQSFKPVVDALKKCLIIKDDSMSIIFKPTYDWVKSKPKEGFIKIIVEEVAA